jgi:hypothetical protein
MKKSVNKLTSLTNKNTLIIRRETIAVLTALQLGGVAGGSSDDPGCGTLSMTGNCKTW